MRGPRLACTLVVLAALGVAPVSARANAMSDRVAAKLVAHYRTASCAELDKERKTPKSARRKDLEQRASERLRADAQLRADFLGKVAVPIADKMLVCGFIP
jgi:hypothetical protein